LRLGQVFYESGELFEILAGDNFQEFDTHSKTQMMADDDSIDPDPVALV
jgi:hypothetical protein